jgi:hypothetical protein
VTIPQNKGFILLEGEGEDQTSIEWADHAGGDLTTVNSSTMTVYADDFMARDIAFKVRLALHHSGVGFVCFHMHLHAVLFTRCVRNCWTI